MKIETNHLMFLVIHVVFFVNTAFAGNRGDEIEKPGKNQSQSFCNETRLSFPDIPELKCNLTDRGSEGKSGQDLLSLASELLLETKTRYQSKTTGYDLETKKISYVVDRLKNVDEELRSFEKSGNEGSSNFNRLSIKNPEELVLTVEREKVVVYLKKELNQFIDKISQDSGFKENSVPLARYKKILNTVDIANRDIFCNLDSIQSNKDHTFTKEQTPKQINGTYFETGMALQLLDDPGDAGKAVTFRTKKLADVIEKILNFPKSIPEGTSESKKIELDRKVKLRDLLVKTIFNEGLRPMELQNIDKFAKEHNLSPEQTEKARNKLKPGDQIGRCDEKSIDYFNLGDFKDDVGFEPSLTARSWLKKSLVEENRPGQSEKMQTKIKALSGFGTMIYAMRSELEGDDMSTLLSKLLNDPSNKNSENNTVKTRTDELLLSVRTPAFDSAEMRKRVERTLAQIDGIDMSKLQTTDASTDKKGMGLIYNGTYARLRIDNETPTHAGSPSLVTSPNHSDSYRFKQGGNPQNPEVSVVLDNQTTQEIRNIKGSKKDGKFRLTPEFRQLIQSQLNKFENTPEVYRPFGDQEDAHNKIFQSAMDQAGGENSIKRLNAPIENPKRQGTISETAMAHMPMGYRHLKLPELLEKKALSHGAGINRWIPIGQYSIQSQKHGFPSAGAHSGGTSDIFMAVNALGNKSIIGDTENAEKMGLLVTAFMTSGGYHTFIETDPIVDAIAHGHSFDIKVTEDQEKNLYSKFVSKVKKYGGKEAQGIAPRLLVENELSNLELSGTPSSL